jgi:predicted CopG family antitoxin
LKKSKKKKKNFLLIVRMMGTPKEGEAQEEVVG